MLPARAEYQASQVPGPEGPVMELQAPDEVEGVRQVLSAGAMTSGLRRPIRLLCF